jgi:CheY-like chemotaxis protein
MPFGDEDREGMRAKAGAAVRATRAALSSPSTTGEPTGRPASPRGSMPHGWRAAASADPQPSDTGRTIIPAESALRVLVVDDNEDAAEMLALVLRKRGYAVVVAFDGEQALALAEANHPEVVLLDIGLPGIDGYEVARRLRARACGAGEPSRPVLVAVTGYGQPGDRQRSREAGFDHHMVKPVAMEKLLPLLELPSR